MQDNNQPMMGQAPAPEPAPTPGPVPEPTPGLAPMPAQMPEQTPVQGQPKKKTALIAIIVAVAVVIILAMVIVIVMAGNKTDTKQPDNNATSKEGGNTKSDDVESDDSDTPESSGTDKQSLRDVQRINDAARMMTAVSQFQTNNNGKLPFGNNYMGRFVQRYVDKDIAITTDTVEELTVSKCSDLFKDPKGDCYKMKYLGSLGTDATLAEEAEAKVSEIGTYYVTAYSICADDKLIQKSAGARTFALMLKLENGKVTCYDNH